MHNYQYDIAVVNAPPQLGLHVLPMGVGYPSGLIGSGTITQAWGGRG